MELGYLGAPSFVHTLEDCTLMPNTCRRSGAAGHSGVSRGVSATPHSGGLVVIHVKKGERPLARARCLARKMQGPTGLLPCP